MTLDPAQHPVRQIIEQRTAAGSRPGHRDDGHHVALVIEGGAMRGVVGAGMVTALEQLGHRDAFDIVYGTSAGALAGAYFIAGQATFGASIYYENLTDGHFFNAKRFISRQGPLISLEYLADPIMSTQKPLHWHDTISSPIDLRVITTAFPDMTSVELGPFTSRDDLQQALTASARVPALSGTPTLIGDQAYVDGSLLNPIPYKNAFATSTHVLVLQTRPHGISKEKLGWPEQKLTRLLMDRTSPAVSEAIINNPPVYAEELRDLLRRSDDHAATPSLLAIRPAAHHHEVDRLEQNPRLLIAGAVSGIEALNAAFGQPPARYYTALTRDDEDDDYNGRAYTIDPRDRGEAPEVEDGSANR